MPRSTRRTSAAQPAGGKENLENQAPFQRERVSPSSNKKARHRLSTTELASLEDLFKRDTHPSRQQKRDLAAQLGMDYKTITIWFQNKRQTTKREKSDGNCKRARADSCLRTVSSPSLNATLAAEAPTASVKVKTDSIASKAIVKIKPLFDALNALTSRSEPMEATNKVSSADDIDPQVSENEREPAQHDQIEREQPKGNAKPVKWTRVRTLEWACERQSKRRKLSKEGYIRLGSEELQDGESDDPPMDSGLSLLALAASTHVGPSQDVMRGASLLLSFKHSWRRRQQDPF